MDDNPTITSANTADSINQVPRQNKYKNPVFFILGIVLIFSLGVSSGIYYMRYFNTNTITNTDHKNEKTAMPLSPKSESNSEAVGTIDTTNWKTYTEPEIGLTIKYPPDWTADSGNIFSPEIYQYRIEHPEDMGVGGGYGVGFHTYTDDIGRELLSRIPENSSTVMIDGMQGKYIIYPHITGETALNPITVFLPYNNMVIDIQFNRFFNVGEKTDQELKEKENIFKAMLQSIDLPE